MKDNSKKYFDWINIPEGFDWVAIDKSGSVYAFTDKPYPDYYYCKWFLHNNQFEEVELINRTEKERNNWIELIFRRPTEKP